ncbi:hypothetical protein M422DRAFT_57369 [Sphaerobolus stellatus SS14]|nr:hypothetical protein M422DRAFT_57369 [Sphaerobolus stellatus SS14]
MASRTYSDAVEHLNRQQSNAATLDAIRATGGRMNDVALSEMIEYLKRIGHTTEDLNQLNVIHITGTKGKGSTSAFVDSILRETLPGKKIGLYTSPHIVSVRERIRINGAPIAEEEFVKYFFEVWDLLDKNTETALPQTAPKPNYFRFLTLLAYHIFLSIKVDATILEVGIGGLYDSTNIVPIPITTGVTALGLDHVNVLGNTLGEIAFNKGGIFKKRVPAFSVEQPQEGMNMLKKCAADRQSSSFTVVPTLPELSQLKLGIAGIHQRQNASLAVYLSHSFLQNTKLAPVTESPVPLSDVFVRGLERAHWPGRCQLVKDPKAPSTTWFLDGSHTTESLICGMDWFTSVAPSLQPDASSHPTRVLIFNCTSGRAGHKFLGTILDTIKAQLQARNVNIPQTSVFTHVIFCTNVTYTDGHFKPDLTSKTITEATTNKLAVQTELASVWSALVPDFPEANIHVLPSIQDAIKVVRSLEGEKPVETLACGSLHLVGGVIEVAGLADVAL